ncbi:MAG TPA: class IV adenylate cyclase [Gemmatimonadales bacterium]|jgi:predicted adenylyl cyclase CyaB|nr:class IV adenylate cyclase [Gemmatimonadales bacterium]
MSASRTAGEDELELKARVDDPVALEAALARAGAELVFRGEMVDRRYDRDGTLEARDEVLRLRVYRGTDAYGVLAWKGPASVRGGYKHRVEHEVRVDDPEGALAILQRLGYEVVMRIDRTIAEYRLAGAAVRIERYPAMDVLVEIEGEPAAIERAVAATGVARDRFLPEPLAHFVAAYERRTGRPAQIAAPPPPAPR